MSRSVKRQPSFEETGRTSSLPQISGLPIQEYRERNVANRIAAENIKNQLKQRDRANRKNPDEITLSPSTSEIETALNDLRLEDIAGSPATGIQLKNMSNTKSITFNGKAGQLNDVLTHVDLYCAINSVISDEAKVAVLAATYRGPALTWLTNTGSHKKGDYDEFVAQTKKQFDLSEQAELGKLTRELTGIRQSGSVQKFAQRFEELTNKTKTPDAVAKAQFISKLKPHIQRAIITNDDDDTSLASIIKEAIRLDAEFYNVRQSNHRHGNSRYPKRDDKGRFKRFKRETE